MAKLIQQLKAQSENAEVICDYNGKNAEWTIRLNGSISFMKFEDISAFVGLAEELNDIANTLVNELNTKDFE